MSGPGPFQVFGIGYAFTLGGVPKLNPEWLKDRATLEYLNQYFLKERMQAKPKKLVRDLEAMQALSVRYDFVDLLRLYEFPNQKLIFSEGTDPDDVDKLIADFVQAVNTKSGERESKLEGVQRSTTELTAAEEWLYEMNKYTLTQERDLPDLQRHFATRYRMPGLSKIPGLFTGQRALRLTEGGTNKASNHYFAVSFSYAQSLENDLPYPDIFAGSRTVRWVSVYPAYEYRFALTKDQTKNLFVSGGAGFHRFSGEAFDTFNKASARGRFGLRYHSLVAAVQADFFGDEIKHIDFGSTDPGTNTWSVGFVLEIAIPRFAR